MRCETSTSNSKKITALREGSVGGCEIESPLNVAATKRGILHLDFGRGNGHTTGIARFVGKGLGNDVILTYAYPFNDQFDRYYKDLYVKSIEVLEKGNENGDHES